MELNPTKREQGAESGLPAAMRTAKLAAKNICRVVEFLCRRTKGRATATVHRASGSPVDPRLTPPAQRSDKNSFLFTRDKVIMSKTRRSRDAEGDMNSKERYTFFEHFFEATTF